MKLLVLSLVSVLVSGCISRDLRAIDDPSDVGVSQTTVIAHRGASAYAPENTMAAFDKAQQLGAVAIETDLQLSKDGRVVLFHDDKLDEKTSLKGFIKDHNWDELSKVDLAEWFAKTHDATTGEVKAAAAATPSRVESSGTASSTPSKKARAGGVKKSSKKSSRKQTREKLPIGSLTRLITLDDLFERYGMTFAYNLELKSDDALLASAAYQIVREYALQNNVTFTSFHTDQLLKMLKVDKTVPLVYLVDDKKTPDLNGEIVRAQTLGFTAVSIRASVVTADLVKRAHDTRLKCIAWGVKSDDDMKHAAVAGVDGMTTDWPDRLMTILKTPHPR